MKLTPAQNSRIEMQAEKKYWAFISYSHKDVKWARWLHSMLERYRIPKRLVGRETTAGRIPRRLRPVFRDRDELAAGVNLSESIQASLRSSRALVVVASPAAAKSPYVDAEIRELQQTGRGDQILCLIVDGEPRALARHKNEADECFPPSLCSGPEPLGADIRPNADGKRDAFLKIVSGLLAIGFDELKQRDQRQRFRRRMLLGGVSVVLAAILAVSLIVAERAREEARTQAAIATLRAEDARHSQYAARIRVAREEYEQNRLAGAAAQLAACPADLRGWEWHYLWRVVNRAPRTWTGGEPSRVSIPGGPVRDARFSEDGSIITFVYAPGQEFRLRLSDDGWTKTNGAAPPPPEPEFLNAEIWQHRDIYEVFPSPDSSRYAVEHVLGGTLFGQLPNFVIVDAASGEPLFEIERPETVTIAFTPDGRHLVSGGSSLADQILLRDSSSGAIVRALGQHPGSVVRFAVSQDSRKAASGAWDGTIKLWDLAGPGEPRWLRGHSSNITVLAFVAGTGDLISLDSAGVMKRWNAGLSAEVQVFGNPADKAFAVSADPTRSRVLWGGPLGVREWSIEAPDGRTLVDGRAVAVHAAAGLAAVVQRRQAGFAALLVDTKGNEIRELIPRVSPAAFEAFFSADGSRVVWREGFTWRTVDATPTSTIRSFEARGPVALSENGDTFAAELDTSSSWRLWSTTSGQPIGQHEGHRIGSLFFSSVGTLAIDLTRHRLRRSAPNQDFGHALSIDSGSTTVAALSPDGRTLIGASNDESIVWNLAGAGGEKRFVGRWSGAEMLLFNPDGSRLLSVHNKTLKLWESRDWTEILNLEGHVGRVESVHFSSDGSRIMSIDAMDTARVWISRPTGDAR